MSAGPQLLLEVRVGIARLFVPRAHLDRLEIVLPAAIPATDERGRPLIARELGPLLGLGAAPPAARRQALSVTLRRRSVALLVDRVEGLGVDLPVQPLAPLLRHRLAAPWVIGAVAEGDEAALVLDLRRIAADVALGAV